VLEDAEDGNGFVESVGRAWIVDDTGVKPALEAVDPVGDGLALRAGQSPARVQRFSMKAAFGFLSYSYGVPLPSVVGGSTLTFPGDVTSFTHLKLLTCSTSNINNGKFQIVLETYPGPIYPTLYWNFAPASGATFEERIFDLRQPDHTEGLGSLTVEEVLAQTRYIAVYFYGETVGKKENATAYIDDITFYGIAPTTPPPTTIPPTSVVPTTDPPTTPTLTATPTATTAPPTSVIPTTDPPTTPTLTATTAPPTTVPPTTPPVTTELPPSPTVTTGLEDWQALGQ
jgi:hypothetical protein